MTSQRIAARPDSASSPRSWPSPFPPDVGFALLHAGAAAAAALPEELALLGADASAGRVRDFSLGRAAARAALAQVDAGAASAQPVLRDRGRRPRWPAGFVGAITHAAGMAAAAAARGADYRGLGLDLERVREPSQRLRARILRPEELAALESDGWGTWAQRFTVAFCAKECVYKAVHPMTGVYLGFQDARIELLAPPQAQAPGRLRWTVLKHCGAAVPAGMQGPGAFHLDAQLALGALWIPSAGAGPRPDGR